MMQIVQFSGSINELNNMHQLKHNFPYRILESELHYRIFSNLIRTLFTVSEG
jgi:hypothetical protein